MIRGVLFDMDGVLVNNTQAHVKAFEIFCERYGVEDWQHKLQTAFGMGNDDIMRLILPEEIIREKGMKALGEEKEAIYREVYAPEIRPVRGLVELLEELRRRGIRCAVRVPPKPNRSAMRPSMNSARRSPEHTKSPCARKTRTARTK